MFYRYNRPDMIKRIDWESQIGRQLRLRDLHAFFAVVRCRSMAKAAAQLGVSQPAVSKVIADLEHALGVRLFDRSPQGVEPTVFGAALLKRGTAAFDELKQGIRDIEFLADPTTGEVRIGCPGNISSTLMLRIVQQFMQKYPRVLLHVDAVQNPQDLPGLHERKYDLLPDELAPTRAPLARRPGCGASLRRSVGRRRWNEASVGKPPQDRLFRIGRRDLASPKGRQLELHLHRGRIPHARAARAENRLMEQRRAAPLSVAGQRLVCDGHGKTERAMVRLESVTDRFARSAMARCHCHAPGPDFESGSGAVD